MSQELILWRQLWPFLMTKQPLAGGRWRLVGGVCGALRQTRQTEDRSVAPKGTTTTSTTTHSRMVIPVVPTQSACSYKTQKSEAQLGQMAENPPKNQNE